MSETTLNHFIGRSQMSAIRCGLVGEESAFFAGKLREFANRVATMPKVYEQDGLGDQAVAHLHYFKGGCDWYITERDLTAEQHQAFGLTDLGYGPELGYISLVEILSHGAEIDLYFKPCTLAELQAAV